MLIYIYIYLFFEIMLIYLFNQPIFMLSLAASISKIQQNINESRQVANIKLTNK